MACDEASLFEQSGGDFPGIGVSEQIVRGVDGKAELPFFYAFGGYLPLGEVITGEFAFFVVGEVFPEVFGCPGVDSCKLVWVN